MYVVANRAVQAQAREGRGGKRSKRNGAPHARLRIVVSAIVHDNAHTRAIGVSRVVSVSQKHAQFEERERFPDS